MSVIADLLWDFGEILFISIFGYYWYLVFIYRSIFVFSYTTTKQNKLAKIIITLFFVNLILSIVLSIYKG